MNKITQYGSVKDGVLTITGKRRMMEDLKAFPDCDIELIIKKRGKRSNPQNRFYWGVVVDEVRREFKRRGMSHTAEEIHEALKLKFNAVKTYDENTGEVLLEIGGTTTEMNKSEFGEYLDRVIQWCNESLEIVIPEAGEQTTLIAQLDESVNATIIQTA